MIASNWRMKVDNVDVEQRKEAKKRRKAKGADKQDEQDVVQSTTNGNWR